MTESAGANPQAPVASASARRLALLNQRRSELRNDFVRRFWLRWHMALMLVATFGTGFLVNHMLLALPVHSMAWRWLADLVVAYLAFFLCVRVWLAYVGARAILSGDWSGNAVSGIDPGSPGWTLPNVFRGGGGSSGGAGASAAWDGVPDITAPVRAAFGGITDGVDFDDGGCLLVVIAIVVLALIGVIAGGAVYMFILAPALLVDAAFNALLAGGLVKSVRRMDEPDWEGSVLRSTWKPFALVAVIAVVAAVIVAQLMPGARTLGEVLMLLR